MAAGLGTASLRVVANTTVFEQTLKRSLKRMSALTAGIFAGAAVGNFLGAAVKDALGLEVQLAKIQTFLQDQPDLVKKAFDAQAVRGLSTELGLGVTEVAEALYYMLGSGVAAAEAMDAVRAAASSAVATTSDLGLVANFTSSGLNAFGGTVDTLTGKMTDAAHINDLFFSALKEGKGTANDLAKYLSTAIPSARGLGIGLGEVVSAASAATLTGKSARKVMTGLDYVMSGLGNSTKGVGEVFKEITGKSFPDFVKGGGKLQDAIKILGSEVGIQQLNQVKGATTGIRAIQELLVVWEDYARVQRNVAKTDGDAAKARDIVNDTTARQIEFIKTRFKNFRGSVGDWLLPVLAQALTQLMVWGGQLKDVLGGVWDQIALGFQAIQPALQIVVDLFQRAFATVDWEALRAVITAAATGIVMGLAPLAAGLIGIATAFGGLLQLLAPIVDLLNQMKPVVVGVAAAVAGYYGALLLLWGLSKLYVAVAKLQVLWSGLMAAAFVIQMLATEGLASAWIALNIVMTANPIGIIIALIAALAAGFIYAWKTSETFRNVVVATLNGIKDATLQIVKVLIEAIVMWLTAPIKMLKAVLDAWAHAPDWLGGGVATSAAAGVQRVLDGIDAIKDGIQGLIDSAQAADLALASIGGGVVMSRAGQLPPGAALAKKRAENAAAAALPKAPATPSFSGGSYTPDAGDDAKKAASEAAKAIKAAMGRIKADLNRIAKNTSKQTADTIKNNFAQLYSDMKDAKVGNAVIKAAKKIEKELLKLAKSRDKIAMTLEKEENALDSLKDKYKSTVTDMMHSFSELGDISNTERMRTVFRQGLFPSAGAQIANLKRALYITDRFKAAIQKLQKMGLKQTSLNELIAAGPEGGLGAAEGLARGGQSAVDTVNTLQDQLNTSGKELGKSLADQWYGHGIQVSKGLIAGLESEQAAILKTMDKMGDKMAEAFKKRLGIKSPSKVFEGFGRDITAGLSQGITGSLGSVSKANGAMAAGASVTFGPGAVVVTGVKNGDEAKGGMLTGKGIVNVLESRSTRAALAGIGG